ncbi:MAG TPA: hypothetical protein VNW06_00625 [Cytophagaceae bacterium]|jgi:hypothetical protein|nr:hypothetical protein [Cytophagaceae bacterium]
MDIIAKTILRQINTLDPWALQAYGSKKIKPLQECKEFEGGIEFQVNGLHFSGKISIQLSWSDEYSIYFIDKNEEIEKEIHGVHFPELVEVLDYIEKG